MAEIVQAGTLKVGDVYFDLPHRGLREVNGRTTLVQGTVYAQLSTRHLTTGNRGSIQLSAQSYVTRVQGRLPEELADMIAALGDGAHLSVFRVGNEVWA